MVYNLLPNPGFEVDTSGWAINTNVTTAVRDVSQFFAGVASLAVTCSGTSPANVWTTTFPGGALAFGVNGGQTYTAQIQAKAAVTGRTISLDISWYTALGAFISTSAGVASAADVTTGWTLLSGTVVAPATAAGGRLIVNVALPAASEVHYFDAASVTGPAGVFGDTLVYSLNRLAGTIRGGAPSRDAQGAANAFAATTGLEVVGALNVKAGNTLPNYRELDGVLNQLAGTSGLASDDAARRI